jgi:predicted Rossmann fold nucleotide-binding protein DprA/Smf involved in DNA uptake
MPPSDAAVFALALQQMNGVGRVTAGRLVRQFENYDALLRYPREQVLTRLKRAPNKEALVSRLFDEDALRERLREARDHANQLAEKRIRLLAPPDDGWPLGLDDAPREHRPVLLYAYGPEGVLRKPLVGLTAQPPLPDAPFERAQSLVRALAEAGPLPAAGASNGFDVVMHKVASGVGHPSVAVAGCGLGQVPGKARPVVTKAVRAGGVMCSPFEMRHGPFDHDKATRAHVLAALCRAVVFVAPQPDTPTWSAMRWALDAGRSVFGMESEDPLPERVHLLDSDVDFEWVAAAARQEDA